MPVDLSQKKIIEQLIRYVALDRGVLVIPKSEAKKYERGLCHGFSVIHSHMAVTKKLSWWKAALRAIVTHEISAKSLKIPIELPDAINPKETVS